MSSFFFFFFLFLLLFFNSSFPSILSEFGTLHMEFAYLSDVTGNPVYRQKVEKIREVVASLDRWALTFIFTLTFTHLHTSSPSFKINFNSIHLHLY